MSKIVVGVCSSIAVYKVCDLVRMLKKRAHDVHVIMTNNATELVTPLTFASLTGNHVHVDTFTTEDRHIHHVALAKDAALFLIAPATANMIGKMAHGIADDLVSTTYLSMSCPVLIAPAMHPDMWANPMVRENVAKLKNIGVKCIEPELGEVASGDAGVGRLADIAQIMKVVLAALNNV